LQKVKDGTISVLANIVETRDKNTGGHIERTSAYIKILLEAMAAHGIYAEEMRGWDIEAVVSSARLHDVGKIMISDLILNKPGKLTSDEFEMIKAHAIEGELIIDKIISQTNDEVFLHHAKLFAGYHHERWDGTGYSRQLKGLEIPLQGRIMAIVDTFDALVSERPYKFAFSVSEAIDIIMTGKGNHFDPLIADIFFKAQDSFKQFLSEEYAQ
jgi:putative two-component system response regulator